MERLAVLSRHLTSGRSLPGFDPRTMELFLDDQTGLKERLYEILRSHPELLPATTEQFTKEEHREYVRRCLRVLLEAGFQPLTYLARDVKKYFCLGSLLAPVDLSLCIKLGVQYSLWGGSVLSLGTERHRQQLSDAIGSFELPGCFAMTELRHGSNVAALQTEAVLDTTTDEWVITTPDDGALKWWIGNAAEDGRMATVFARLKVPAPDGSGVLSDKGVHALVVPLRGEGGARLPGVDIRDCGYKVGLQGVDNGSLKFSGVRVPRANLLDRFATVDREGNYRSPYSAARRFGMTLGELTGGRVGLAGASLAVLKAALTITIRYSAGRQQFGPPDEPEISVLDYSSQQGLLMPALATAYALHFGVSYLTDRYAEARRSRDEELLADVHALSAGLKAYTTAYTANALSSCREMCGGHGYAACNRFGAWRSDHDIFQTFEGDNTVLLQQLAALLLKKYREKFQAAPLAATYKYLSHLLANQLPQNPLTAHATEPRHLRDPAFLAAALRYRAGRLLFTLAQRLRKHTPRLGAFQAWNKCLPHVLALARAHIESVVHARFADAVAACPDPDCSKSLKVMADVFALSAIQRDVLFRNDDYVGADKAKAIARLLQGLHGQMRGVALPLVAAFNIPDHILRAPIGLSTHAQHAYQDYLRSSGWV